MYYLQPPRTGEDLPGAIITISKNVLGRNVTERLTEPLVRVLPIGGTENSPAGVRTCTTPGGSTGYCEDLSNCPQLLLDLGNLRQSICFKSLFVPGVCCPKRGGGSDTTLVNSFYLVQSTIVYHTIQYHVLMFSIHLWEEDCVDQMQPNLIKKNEFE